MRIGCRPATLGNVPQPPHPEFVAVRMTREMRAELEQIAEQQDRPLAWVVRQACAAYLAARAPDS